MYASVCVAYTEPVKKEKDRKKREKKNDEVRKRAIFFKIYSRRILAVDLPRIHFDLSRTKRAATSSEI
jgi:hypothetical protein